MPYFVGFVPQVQVSIRSSQNAGLGSAAAVGHSMDISASKLQQAKRWSHAQERYNRLADVQDLSTAPESGAGQVQTAVQKKPVVTRMTFVKKSTLNPTSSQNPKAGENT